MSGGNRGRALLRAQRRPKFRGVHLPPLTAEGPPDWLLDADERRVYHEIIAATPARLALGDIFALAGAASAVMAWRRDPTSIGLLRFSYRCLGDFFVPMQARRRLLFPNRVK